MESQMEMTTADALKEARQQHEAALQGFLQAQMEMTALERATQQWHRRVLDLTRQLLTEQLGSKYEAHQVIMHLANEDFE